MEFGFLEGWGGGVVVDQTNPPQLPGMTIFQIHVFGEHLSLCCTLDIVLNNGIIKMATFI